LKEPEVSLRAPSVSFVALNYFFQNDQRMPLQFLFEGTKVSSTDGKRKTERGKRERGNMEL
jgi:hypothetical protein